MQDITASFDFVKSSLSPVSSNVATSDFTSILMIIIFGLIFISLLIIEPKKILVKKNSGVSKTGHFNSINNIFKKISIVLFFSMLLGFIFIIVLNFHKNVAVADNENKDVGISNSKVLVAESGIDNVEPIVLTNSSMDTSYSIVRLSLDCTNPIAQDSNWKIMNNGVEIYSGSPDDEVELNSPVQIACGNKTNLTVEVSMDAQKANSLIDRSPVFITIFFITSSQYEGLAQINITLEDYTSCLNILHKLSESEKESYLEYINELANNAKNAIYATTDPDEIQQIVNDYNSSAIASIKEASVINAQRNKDDLYDLIDDCHNLTKTVRDGYKDSVNLTYDTLNTAISSAASISELNNANTTANSNFSNIENTATDAEAAATWTINFEANGGTPAPVSQNIKYGSKVSTVTDPSKGLDLTFVGWFYDSSLASAKKWNFTESEVGITAGDEDNCVLTLYAKFALIKSMKDNEGTVYTPIFNGTASENGYEFYYKEDDVYQSIGDDATMETLRPYVAEATRKDLYVAIIDESKTPGQSGKCITVRIVCEECFNEAAYGDETSTSMEPVTEYKGYNKKDGEYWCALGWNTNVETERDPYIRYKDAQLNINSFVDAISVFRCYGDDLPYYWGGAPSICTVVLIDPERVYIMYDSGSFPWWREGQRDQGYQFFSKIF